MSNPYSPVVVQCHSLNNIFFGCGVLITVQRIVSIVDTWVYMFKTLCMNVRVSVCIIGDVHNHPCPFRAVYAPMCLCVCVCVCVYVCDRECEYLLMFLCVCECVHMCLVWLGFLAYQLLAIKWQILLLHIYTIFKHILDTLLNHQTILFLSM